MGKASAVQQSSLVIRVREGAGGRAYWDAQWRYRLRADEEWKLKKRRLGLAWRERDDAGGWRKRRGRCPEGWLDERAANVAAVAAMDDHAHELVDEERTRREAAERTVTVRELGTEWLCWLEEVRGAKPSTIADYGFLLREHGLAFRRGERTSAGRIMAALGDRPAAEVTTAEVSRLLRSLDREGLKPRNVNKHRQVLAAMFTYACEDTHRLSRNQVTGTDKRREDPPAALDYYEVEEVEPSPAPASKVSTGPAIHPPTLTRRTPARTRTARTPRRSDCCFTPACGSARCLRSGGRTST